MSKNLPKYIASKKFLPNYNPFSYKKGDTLNTVPAPGTPIKPGPILFSGSDSEDFYKKNSEKMPEDWLYHNKSVSYTLNSEGYRAPEFDTIDWSNSVVLFGCSCVYGVGLDDSDTISAQLEKLINVPVINMGAGGSSIDHAYYNQLILSNIVPKPKAVINVWTSSSRVTCFTPQALFQLGPWMKNFWHGRLYSLWCFSDANPATHAYFLRQSSRILWKDTLHKEYTVILHPHDMHADEYPIIKRFKKIDDARDIIHPGINSARLAAIKIAEDLKL
jgi:hypothetical protein